MLGFVVRGRALPGRWASDQCQFTGVSMPIHGHIAYMDTCVHAHRLLLLFHRNDSWLLALILSLSTLISWHSCPALKASVRSGQRLLPTLIMLSG